MVYGFGLYGMVCVWLWIACSLWLLKYTMWRLYTRHVEAVHTPCGGSIFVLGMVYVLVIEMHVCA